MSVSDSIKIYTDRLNPDTLIHLLVTPKYARPQLIWKDSGTAAELKVQPNGWDIKLKALHPRFSKITVQSVGAPVLSKDLIVQVLTDTPTLEVTPSQSYITSGTKLYFTARAHQEHGEINGYSFDLNGDGKWDSAIDLTLRKGKVVELPKQSFTYMENGKYKVRFRVRDTEGNESEITAMVEVGEKKPAIQLLPKDTTISIGDEILFRSVISESGGKLAAYAWDFNGDGKNEDSAKVNDTLVERFVSHTFTDTGKIFVKLKAWDTEKNFGSDSALVTVILDASFAILSKRTDNTISINDTVRFVSSIRNEEGRTLVLESDFDADGKVDATESSSSKMILNSRKYAYPKAGDYKAVFRVSDPAGKSQTDTVIIHVELDPPNLSLGKDTTLLQGSQLTLHFTENDKYGSITKRKIKIGANGFTSLSKVDTTFLLPESKGSLQVIGKVTDDDGVTTVDTIFINTIFASENHLASLFLPPPLELFSHPFSARIHLPTLQQSMVPFLP